MRNIWTIARKEFRQYFISPIAYVVALLILLITGIYFVLIVYQSAAGSLYYQTPPPDSSNVVSLTAFLFLFTIPAITMRLIADEKRTGTLELLLTSPVKDWELIVGKWLGAFLFVLSIIAVTFIYPIVLNKLVTPGIDQGLMVANFLGLILVAAAFLAIGTAISSFFNNQFAALFATLVALFFLWYVIGWPAIVMPYGGDIFNYLSMGNHFFDYTLKGIIALPDLVYYLSLIVLGLFMGSVAVEVRRWQ